DVPAHRGVSGVQRIDGSRVREAAARIGAFLPAVGDGDLLIGAVHVRRRLGARAPRLQQEPRGQADGADVKSSHEKPPVGVRISNGRTEWGARGISRGCAGGCGLSGVTSEVRTLSPRRGASHGLKRAHARKIEATSTNVTLGPRRGSLRL